MDQVEFTVRRDHVSVDTVKALNGCDTAALLSPPRIVYASEAGEDEGGPRREWAEGFATAITDDAPGGKG